MNINFYLFICSKVLDGHGKESLHESELLRFNYIDGSDVLSDGQIHNLYYGLMSEVMDEQSPSFSPETQPVEIAPDSPELFDTSSSSGTDILELVARSTPTSAARDLMNLAAAAERAAAATVEVNSGAASALSALATAASVLVRGPNNESPTSTRGTINSTGHVASPTALHGGATNSTGHVASPTAPHGVATNSTGHVASPTAPHGGATNSTGHVASPTASHSGVTNSTGHVASPTASHSGITNSTGHVASPSAPRRGAINSTGHGSSPSAPRRSASNSSSPYYGEPQLCVVCTDEMLSPGVTDGSCDHRSTCTPCLRRILFYAHGSALCPLCRVPYYRVY